MVLFSTMDLEPNIATKWRVINIPMAFHDTWLFFRFKITSYWSSSTEWRKKRSFAMWSRRHSQQIQCAYLEENIQHFIFNYWFVRTDVHSNSIVYFYKNVAFMPNKINGRQNFQPILVLNSHKKNGTVYWTSTGENVLEQAVFWVMRFISNVFKLYVEIHFGKTVSWKSMYSITLKIMADKIPIKMEKMMEIKNKVLKNPWHRRQISFCKR